MVGLCGYVAFYTEECSIRKASYRILMYFLLIIRLVWNDYYLLCFSVVGTMLDLYCMDDGYYYMVLCGFWILWKLSPYSPY